MKKFLMNILLYASIIIAVTLCLNIPCLRRSHSEARKFLDGVPANIKLCNFGSSHGLYGYDYSDVSKDFQCFNFALGSQPLFYDFRIMQLFRDRIQPGATVFITVSYFSFFGGPERERREFKSMNKRYYTFLPAELIEDYDLRTDFYVNCLPVLSYANIIELIKACLPDKGYNPVMTPEAAAKHGQARYEYHVAGKVDKQGRRMLKTEALEAIYGMIALCREIGAEPVLVTTPYLHEYPDAVKRNDPEFFGDFYSVINEIIRKEGVKYYDYSRDERFCNEYSLFMDTDHMNQEGARCFTNILLREVLGIETKTP